MTMRRVLDQALTTVALTLATAACAGADPDGSFGGGTADASSSEASTGDAASTTDASSATSAGGSTSSVTSSTSSGEGGSGGGGGGGAVCQDLGDACTQCEATACPSTYCDCYEDSECLALSACIVACGGTTECYQGCATDHPTAISRGALLVDCAATSCPEACPGYAPLTPCQKCLYTECQPEMNTCISNAECTALLYCLDECEDAECTNACYFEYPDGTGDAGPVGTCLQEACAADCG